MLSDIRNNSSCGWLINFGFVSFNTQVTFCPTRLCAFALNPLMEYGVLFSSTFVNSVMLVFIDDSSLFTFHSEVSFRDCHFSCFSIVVHLCEHEELFFVSDVGRRRCHLAFCCLNFFPEVGPDLSRNFEFPYGDKFGSVCVLAAELEHKFTCVPH